MENKIIDGKAIAAELKKEIAQEVAQIIDKNQKAPHLAAVLVGNDPASKTYVSSKEKACKAVGITSSVYQLSENTTEKELIDVIQFLNNDDEIDGFIVQLPLPKHINPDRVIETIHPAKDVDGFTPTNVGRMQLGMPCYVPATPFGIVELLKRSNVEVEGKHVVVLGRSNIVGTPISILLSRKAEGANATVTLCHSRSNDLISFTKQADILIAAIGQKEFVKADMVKKGVVIIDVGIHRVADSSNEKGYKIVGDVDYEPVSKMASKITPVPGGVGPMTIVSLLYNTLLASKKAIYK
ncbi:MAG: bifunctional 5,10-methylenetetrahydrofolate dehydrogenase/5,10-methenyltetrahydrofolate cyclohydrolase [Lentimicrobiaceae bacterium]|nr:bifunctional 5,10-methylenetetrahydrofolate dehydrogenase/5,10-methenyltetrahydrofolate cyclohydrolase [Lentimicrobiaceae bacterium]